MKQVQLDFPHGLGDCVYLACALPLYVKRGYDITVRCNPDKRIVFEDSGVHIVHEENPDRYPNYSWDESPSLGSLTGKNFGTCNKAAFNFGKYPMPYIGCPNELWKEFVDTKIDILPFVPAEVWAEVDAFAATLPRPLILVHTIGNAFQDLKSIDEQTTLDMYRALLDKTDGCLLLLDWDNRVPRMNSYRVRHLTDDWKWIDVTTLLALIERADLLIGIDSGPCHLVRFTNTPAIGIYPAEYTYPARVTLPHPNKLCIVPRSQTIEWNQKARIEFNIVHCDGDKVTGEFVAHYAKVMLDKPRYLDESHKAADAVLQQFVLDFERGYGNDLSSNVDRHTSFDILLREMSKRFDGPTIVETGCIRSPEDFRGAGYSTYLFGAYVERAGGKLYSVDLSPENCEFARSATVEMNHVEITCDDSVTYLRNFSKSIDVLFLDSLDTFVQGYAGHCLDELEAALPKLHANSVIVMDDTVYRSKQWTGKGTKAVPYLLEIGWRILYSGYQTVLTRVR
jgi:hypothetical protein